jgi:hypothetical protein
MSANIVKPTERSLKGNLSVIGEEEGSDQENDSSSVADVKPSRVSSSSGRRERRKDKVSA